MCLYRRESLGIRLYTHTHTHTHICAHTCTHTYTHTHADMHVDTHIHKHMYTHTHKHMFTPTHKHIYMYTHMMHIRTCTLIYTCTPYMCVHVSVCLCVCVCACVCLCVHTCMCGGVFINLTFMNYTCRYFRDATLNIYTCPSKDLSIEDTGWQSNCSFFQEELAYYYKMHMFAVLCYVCVNDNVCV